MVDYPRWRCTYSNEDFDRIQALAIRLGNEQRANGTRTEPGYGQANLDLATKIVKDAQY